MAYYINDSVKRVESILFESPLNDGKPVHDVPSNLEAIGLALLQVTVIALHISVVDNTTDNGVNMLKLSKIVTSEICNIIYDSDKILDVWINNDDVVAICNTPLKSDIDTMIEYAARLNTIASSLQIMLKKHGFDIQVSIGISMDYGNVNFSNFSIHGKCIHSWSEPMINSVIQNARLTNIDPIRISSTIYNNIKEEYQKFFNIIGNGDVYASSIINVAMDNWNKDNM